MLAGACEPLSVAEVAAKLHLVVGVVAVIADDLIAAGLLDVHHTDPVEIELRHADQDDRARPGHLI